MIGRWSRWLPRLRGRQTTDRVEAIVAPLPIHPDPGDGKDQAPAKPADTPARTALAWLLAGEPAAALAAEAVDPELATLAGFITDGEDILRGSVAGGDRTAGTEPLAGIMLAPSDRARTLAVVFGADDGGFAVPRTLARDGRSNLLFVRDPHACLAMLGVARLGATYDDCLLAITRLARVLGVNDIVCIGGGAAAYTALRYGLDLGASGVLALGTLTRLEQGRYVPGLRPGRRTAALLRLAAELGADLDEVFAQAALRPGLVLCRPANTPAQALATLPGVSVIEAPRSAARDLLGWADTEGQLAEMLGQVLRCRPVG